MIAHTPAWARFRRLPTWGQSLIWFFLWPIPTALYAASRPPAAQRRWWAITAVVTLAWVGITVTSSSQDSRRTEQAGEVVPTTTTTRAETPGTTASTAAPAPDTSTSTAPGNPTTTTAGSSETTSTPAPGSGSSGSTTTSTRPPVTSPPGDPNAILASLRVAPEGPRTGYSRDLFPHWIDADGDRCDTREEVLIAESLTPAQVDPYGCKVVAGDWFSVYDDVTTEQPGDLDIDHVVALAEAWDSGASAWDEARRRDFANDLGFDGSLIAVTASSNRAKGDQDPAEWLPPRREAWCHFATDWASVKVRWNLTADQPEVTAIRTALETCDGSPAPPPAAVPTSTTTTAPPPPTSAGSVTLSVLDCQGERVTVTNGGPAAVELSGWTIHDDGTKHTFTFSAGFTLTPGASATVRSGGTAGPGELQWTTASVWNNDGDTASLVDENRGHRVDQELLTAA